MKSFWILPVTKMRLCDIEIDIAVSRHYELLKKLSLFSKSEFTRRCRVAATKSQSWERRTASSERVSSTELLSGSSPTRLLRGKLISTMEDSYHVVLPTTRRQRAAARPTIARQIMATRTMNSFSRRAAFHLTHHSKASGMHASAPPQWWRCWSCFSCREGVASNCKSAFRRHFGLVQSLTMRTNPTQYLYCDKV